MRACYAAVDWGTSSFRLWLIGADGSVVSERRSAEGMAVATGCGFGKILDQHLAALDVAPDLPVVICGMAGARQGWIEAGYRRLPDRIDSVLDDAVRVPGEARRIMILPGLAQRDPDRPDVMRGEETQILGALELLAQAPSRLCMPGTHSKWVQLDGRRVTRFSTFMTGELFDLLSKQSILAHSLAGATGFDGQAFRAAVREAQAAPARIANRLFSIRAGQLLLSKNAAEAEARLSGLLIGTEIAGALGDAATAAGDGSVGLVATGPLADLYADALQELGLAVARIDADAAVRAGLARAARHLALSPEA